MRLPPALTALAALALAVGLVTVPAAPAQAHARLIASTPSSGATLDSPPETIVLEFNEPVEAEFGQLQVSGPDGTRLDQETPTSTDTFVEAPLAPPTLAGTHTVAYRVISADGHPVEGTFTYEIAEGAVPPPEPDPEPTPEPVEEPEPTAEPAAEPTPTPTPDVIDAEETAADAEDGGGLPLVPLLIGGLLVLGVAGALLARRGGEPDTT